MSIGPLSWREPASDPVWCEDRQSKSAFYNVRHMTWFPCANDPSMWSYKIPLVLFPVWSVAGILRSDLLKAETEILLRRFVRYSGAKHD